MHRSFITIWFLFPPRTKEVQVDEKWAFVGKKEKTVDGSTQNDAVHGDLWDHTAIDAESRLLLALIPGKRTTENSEKLIAEIKSRTGGRTDILITSDEHAPYETAIKKVYGEEVTPQRKPGPGRNPKPRKVVPSDLCYATVRKTRKEGRVVHVIRKLVFGTLVLLASFLAGSTASETINTSFVERNNATDRGQNARKRRKTYCFSKKQEIHIAVSYFVAYGYNFMWPVRTLELAGEEGQKIQRTPAMVAGLTDHIWALREWCTFPVALPS